MSLNNNSPSATTRPHPWRFFRSGGFDQVRLDSGADIAAIPRLDQKLWAALSCPVKGTVFDARTLALLDDDNDGRIRAPEVIAAVQWTTALLNNPDELASRPTAMPLAAVKSDSEEGARILASARQILANLGRADASQISPDDTQDTAKIFANTKFNGDGIITSAAADDDFTRGVIEDIVNCYGGELDRSGAPGINAEKVALFTKDAQAYSDWWGVAESNRAEILPYGDATEKTATDFERVQAKVDDYFTRCRVAKFDPRAAAHLNRSAESFAALAARDLTPGDQDLAAFPLATIDAAKPLPLVSGINPAWEDAVKALRSEVVMPLFGSITELSPEQWQTISAKFAAHKTWKQSEPQVNVAKLGRDRVRKILTSNVLHGIAQLIAKDKALEQEANAIAAVEKLTRFYCHLHRFLCNFVSFSDFYTRKGIALFQIGTLYLDGRACELCTSVDDVAKHSTLAPLSKVYLTYCDCTRKGSTEKMTIVAGITGGDSDNLLVGRNGLFYDRQGRDWDATITKIVEHPISIRQAFWAPYKRMGRMIGEQIEKMAAARDKAAQDKAAAGIVAAGEKVDGGKVAAPVPFDVAKFAGIFAAIGLAIGAIGTALATLVSSFVSLVWWQMPLAIVGVILIVSVPSMIIAALKLRQRNLAPLLDAGGWSVNTQAKINIPFGGALTSVAKMPPGAKRSGTDPFAEKKTPWKFYLFVLILLGVGYGLWHKGYLTQWYEKARGVTTQQTTAPEQESR